MGLTAPDGLYFVMCEIEIRDSWFSLYEGVESLVSCEQISCRWVSRFPPNEGIKEGYPLLRNRYFTLLARLAGERLQNTDRHRLAAYHNKHC